MSSYVLKQLVGRKEEVGKVLRTANSKISISIDVWMSSNYLSFLGVVAHFVSKSTSINSWGALIGSSIATPI
jgi:hypothetical protein